MALLFIARQKLVSKNNNVAKPRRQRREKASLQDLGLRVAGLGLLFLIVPLFLGTSPLFKILAPLMQLSGWLFLSAGLLVLGLAHLRKAKQKPAMPALVSRANTSAGAERVEPKLHPSSGILDSRWGRAAEKIAANPLPRLTEWNQGVFAAIEWRRFEAVCEALFTQAGFKTTSQSHGADGGVDIWLYSDHAEGPAAIAQCKHWNGRQVGVKEMREFYGVMASHQLKRGTYATSSTYTEDALKFAKANGINAMDGARLLQQIATRSPVQQQALLAVAYEGEYWRPTCASCGIKTVERQSAKGRAAFWGCVNYPRCRTNFPMAVSAHRNLASSDKLKNVVF